MIDIVQLVDDFKAGKTVSFNGNSYKNNANSWSFNQAIRAYLQTGVVKSITVPMATHQDYIGNRDLEFIGDFTVGRGKVKYHDFIWWSTGTCTVYPEDRYKHSPRVLKGNEMITIHFNT